MPVIFTPLLVLAVLLRARHLIRTESYACRRLEMPRCSAETMATHMASFCVAPRDRRVRVEERAKWKRQTERDCQRYSHTTED